MDQSQWSRDQAIIYRDFIRDRHHERLRDLAWWMHESKGPIDEMDASLASLDELYKWVNRFRESSMRGVPADPDVAADPRWETFVLRDGDIVPATAAGMVHERRREYVVENLEHYLLLVAQRVDPSASWEAFIEKKARVHTIRHNETGIGLNGGWKSVYLILGWYEHVYDAPAKSQSWRSYITDRLGLGVEPPEQQRGPSALLPLLDRRPIDYELRPAPPRFQLPGAARKPGLAARLIVAAAAADQDPAVLPPLSPQLVCSSLMYAGFRQSGSAITVADLVDGARFLHLNGRCDAMVGVNEGQPVGVFLAAREYEYLTRIPDTLVHGSAGEFRHTTPFALWMEKAEFDEGEDFAPSLPWSALPDGKRLRLISKPDGRKAASQPMPESDVVALAEGAGFIKPTSIVDGIKKPITRLKHKTCNSELQIVKARGQVREVVIHRKRSGVDDWAEIVTSAARRADRFGSRLYAPNGAAVPYSRPIPPLFALPLRSRGYGDSINTIFIVADGTTSLDPMELKPLHPPSIADALNSLGFRAGDREIDVTHLVGGYRFEHPKGLLASPGTLEGELRTVHLDLRGLHRWEIPIHMYKQLDAARPTGAFFAVREELDKDLRRQLPKDFVLSLSAKAIPGSGEMIFAFPLESEEAFERPEKMKPLPTRRLLTVLNALGVRGAGGKLTLAELETDEAEYETEDLLITVATRVDGGKLRALWLEMHNETPLEWTRVYNAMSAFANAVNARFCTEDELLDLDD